HTYQGGNEQGFPVQLTVTDSLGVTVSAPTRRVYIEGDPVVLPAVELTPSSFIGVSPKRIRFTATASSPRGIANYSWNLGPCGVQAGTDLNEVECQYLSSNSPMVFPVTVPVTDADGFTNQATANVRLNPVEPPTGAPPGGGGGTAG